MNETIYQKLKKQIELNLANKGEILLSETLKSVSVEKHRDEIRRNGIVAKDYIERIKKDYDVLLKVYKDGPLSENIGLVEDLKISRKKT